MGGAAQADLLTTTFGTTDSEAISNTGTNFSDPSWGSSYGRTLWVKDDSTQAIHGYMKFNLTSLLSNTNAFFDPTSTGPYADIRSLRLTMNTTNQVPGGFPLTHVMPSSGVDVDVYRVADDSWASGAPVNNPWPSFGSKVGTFRIASLAGNSNGQAFTVDINPSLIDWTNDLYASGARLSLGLAFKTPTNWTGGQVYFQGANYSGSPSEPVLTFIHEVPEPTALIGLSSLALVGLGFWYRRKRAA